jgi:hypothetical protein
VQPKADAVDPCAALDYISRSKTEPTMRAETEKTIAEIEQVVGLLRRHL